MLKLYKYEEKTLEQSYQKCLNELNKTEEQLYIRTYETKSGLFKNTKYVVEAIEKSEVENYIKNYLNQLSNLSNIEIEYEITEEDNVWNVSLNSNNNSILIGKDGKTLNAIQTTLKQSLKNNTDFSIKINVDVSNYKENKMKHFEENIIKVIKEVQASKISAKLDPMTAYERHLVHDLAAQFENIKTHSEEMEPNRYIVIEYEESH